MIQMETDKIKIIPPEKEEEKFNQVVRYLADRAEAYEQETDGIPDRELAEIYQAVMEYNKCVATDSCQRRPALDVFGEKIIEAVKAKVKSGE